MKGKKSSSLSVRNVINFLHENDSQGQSCSGCFANTNDSFFSLSLFFLYCFVTEEVWVWKKRWWKCQENIEEFTSWAWPWSPFLRVIHLLFLVFVIFFTGSISQKTKMRISFRRERDHKAPRKSWQNPFNFLGKKGSGANRASSSGVNERGRLNFPEEKNTRLKY